MIIQKEKLNALSHIYSSLPTGEPCITLHIPTHRAGNVQEDRIRFKNTLQQAIDMMVEGKMFLEKRYDKKEAKKNASSSLPTIGKRRILVEAL